jgi:hypothetical protein
MFISKNTGEYSKSWCESKRRTPTSCPDNALKEVGVIAWPAASSIDSGGNRIASAYVAFRFAGAYREPPEGLFQEIDSAFERLRNLALVDNLI